MRVLRGTVPDTAEVVSLPRCLLKIAVSTAFCGMRDAFAERAMPMTQGAWDGPSLYVSKRPTGRQKVPSGMFSEDGHEEFNGKW